MQSRIIPLALLLALGLIAPAYGQWTAELVTTLKSFEAPESVAVDEAGNAYVSNMKPKMGDDGLPRYWEDDGGGYLSLIKYDAEKKTFDVEMKWIVESEDAPLNCPKGVSLSESTLWVNDNKRVLAYDVDDPKAAPKVIEPEGAGKLNDIASGGPGALATDTENGIAHMIHLESGRTASFPLCESVNGITVRERQLYCVSWDNHEIYKATPSQDRERRDGPNLEPLGLAEHFESLDSIEILEGGDLLVTDFAGNKVCVVSPEDKTVTTIAEMETPADVGLDRKNGLLFVPSVEGNIVNVYRLTKSTE